MQNSQFDNTWGDSDINWWKTWVAAKKSNLESSIVAESSEHSDFVQALKLPKTKFDEKLILKLVTDNVTYLSFCNYFMINAFYGLT